MFPIIKAMISADSLFAVEMLARDQGGPTFCQPRLQPSPELLNLRKKTLNVMNCRPKDYAELVLEEHRFLLAKAQRLKE